MSGLLKFSFWLLTLLLVLAAMLYGAVLWKAKPAAAAICPRCFGFEPDAPGVYVQRGMPLAERRLTQRKLALADQCIQAFYGESRDHPRVLVCTDQDCIRRIGGGQAASGSIGSLVLLLGPHGVGVTEIAHELSLMEVARGIGVYHSVMDSVPAWFDQGLAVLVADDPEYIGPVGARGDRCLVKPEGDLPADMQQWINESNQYPFINAQAACDVYRWMSARGGSHAVVRLLVEVAHGQAFSAAYAAR